MVDILTKSCNTNVDGAAVASLYLCPANGPRQNSDVRFRAVFGRDHSCAFHAWPVRSGARLCTNPHHATPSVLAPRITFSTPPRAHLNRGLRSRTGPPQFRLGSSETGAQLRLQGVKP
ncbi:MAG: hypothetical protein AMXMBFR82_49900 [Candidatus Hydrogenedentota bacterium]